MKLKEVPKSRGYIAIGAGIFLVVLMAGLYLFFGHLASSGAMDVPEPAGSAFFGKLDLGFALLAISGAIGIGNGLWVVRRRTANTPLTIIGFLVAASALYSIWQATKLLPPD